MMRRMLLAILLLPFLAIEMVSAEHPVVSKGLNISATVTAYSSTRQQTDSQPRITASGKEVAPGVVACPQRFPFGTKVSIDGRIYECQDRLNARYRNRFDIWKPNTAAALRFGKRWLPIVVLDVPHAESN